MEECTSRVLEVWRRYIPNQAFFNHRARVKKLESYLHNIVKTRYRDIENGIEHDDIDSYVFLKILKKFDKNNKLLKDLYCILINLRYSF